MDVRLVQLLGSFIVARSEYVLARLEFAAYHADLAAPGNIDRLPDASEATLHEVWPKIETQVADAVLAMRKLARAHRAYLDDDVQFTRLGEVLREMEQYARAIAWVLSVESS